VRALWIVALAFIVLVPRVAAAEEPRRTPVLDWETGAGKSYWIPSLEIGGFIFGLLAIRLFASRQRTKVRNDRLYTR